MLYALAAMIVVTFVVAFYLLSLRIKAVKSGQMSIGKFRLVNAEDMPNNMQQAARNYSNLFEMPILFYTAGAIAISMHLETTSMIVASWLFVISRAIHSWIHVTYNNVIHRLQIFLFGNLCILVLWGLLLWQYTTRTN